MNKNRWVKPMEHTRIFLTRHHYIDEECRVVARLDGEMEHL